MKTNTIPNKENKLIGLCKECGEVCLAETIEQMQEVKRKMIEDHNFSHMNYSTYPCPICNKPIYEILPVSFTKDL